MPTAATWLSGRGYTAKQAVGVMREVEAEHVIWFEEPVSSEDLAGCGPSVLQSVIFEVAGGAEGRSLADRFRVGAG